MGSDLLMAVLGAYAGRVLLLVVWIVTLVLAVGRWERHPTVSLLVVVAASVEIFQSVVGPLVMTALSSSMLEEGAGRYDFRTVMDMVGLVQSLLSAGGWGLLIWAAFMDRKAPAQSPASAVPAGPATAGGPR